MTPIAKTEAELLLGHGAWIRSLARHMVSDEHHAEDLVQETWLVALRRGAEPLASSRAWLAGVLTRVVWRHRRAEVRRAAHEQLAARSTPIEASDASEIVEAAALGRRLADLVLALEEPFRTAVILRFYEDLPPRAIAARLGVPVRTVNSRLERALARLRARWRSQSGGGRAAMGSLLLLARVPKPAGSAPASALPIGVSLMNAKLFLGAAAVVACGGLYWMWSRAQAAPARPPEPAAAAEQRAAHASDAPPAPLRGNATRRVAAAEPLRPTAAEDSSPPAVLLRSVRGRVLDPEATPLAGIEVEFQGGSPDAPAPRAVSGPGGFFELEVPLSDGRIAAVDPRLVTVLIGNLRAASAVEPLLVVAPVRDVGGRVVDAFGAALSGARVSLEPPEGFLRRFDAVLDANDLCEARTPGDGAGRFELLGVADIPGAVVVASLGGFETASLTAPPGTDLGLVIELGRGHGAGRVLVGTVLDPTARPVSGARVSLGGETSVSDSAGEFHISIESAEEQDELVAVHPGHLPARLRAGRDPLDGAPVWPDAIVLVLGREPLAISGRVIDASGRPRAGLRLWLEEPTHFGVIGDMDGSVEFLIAPEAGCGDEYWRWTTTDADGRFRIAGLLPRSYGLRLLDGRTLEQQSAGPFAAGAEDVRIVFDRGPLRRIAGRVVSTNGVALEGVTLALLRPAWGGVSTHLETGSATSAAEGRFVFEGIGGEELLVWARGDDVVPQMVAVPEPAEDFEIVLAVRCHIKVDLGSNPARADAIEVRDADGESLDLMEVGASGVTTMHRALLVEGRSATLGVEERARTLILLKDGIEVGRLDVRLVPGRLNRIEP
jgi:RNA polymerase sigma-70 factor (ECF subfamily)